MPIKVLKRRLDASCDRCRWPSGRLTSAWFVTRLAASNRIKIHGATRVHAKHPATTEGATRNPSATGTVALSSLKLRAAGRRAASSQVARFYSSDFCQRSRAPRTFARISPEANPKLAVTRRCLQNRSRAVQTVVEAQEQPEPPQSTPQRCVSSVLTA